MPNSRHVNSFDQRIKINDIYIDHVKTCYLMFNIEKEVYLVSDPVNIATQVFTTLLIFDFLASRFDRALASAADAISVASRASATLLRTSSV